MKKVVASTLMLFGLFVGIQPLFSASKGRGGTFLAAARRGAKALPERKPHRTLAAASSVASWEDDSDSLRSYSSGSSSSLSTRIDQYKAFFRVAGEGDVASLREFLGAGIHVNATDAQHKTALYICMSSYEEEIQHLAFFLSTERDATRRAHLRERMSLCQRRFRAAIVVLIEHKADSTIVPSYWDKALRIWVIKKTPLMMAASIGDLAVFKALGYTKEDLLIRDCDGNSAAHYAVGTVRAEIARISGTGVRGS